MQRLAWRLTPGHHPLRQLRQHVGGHGDGGGGAGPAEPVGHRWSGGLRETAAAHLPAREQLSVASSSHKIEQIDDTRVFPKDISARHCMIVMTL